MSRISFVYVICLVLVSSGMALQFGQSTDPESAPEPTAPESAPEFGQKKVFRGKERRNHLASDDIAAIARQIATSVGDDIEGSEKEDITKKIEAAMQEDLKNAKPEDLLVRDAGAPKPENKKISQDPGPEARDLAIASGLAMGLAVRAVAAASSPFNSTTAPTTAAVALPSGIFAAMMDKYHTHFPMKYVPKKLLPVGPENKWSNWIAAHLVRAGYAAAVGAGIGAAVQSIPGLDTDDLVYPAVGVSSGLMSYGIGQWRDTSFYNWLQKKQEEQEVKDEALVSKISGLAKDALRSKFSKPVIPSGKWKRGWSPSRKQANFV